MDLLVQDYPDVGKPFVGKSAALIAKADREDEISQARTRKSKGVSLGMSPEDVIASSWGKPSRVNRTLNAFGTSEQWVYGLRSYLYFENGVLTSIQN